MSRAQTAERGHHALALTRERAHGQTPRFPTKIAFFCACWWWRAPLQPNLEPVEPDPSTSPGNSQQTNHAQRFHLGDGLASIIAKNSHKRLEVGLIGCEGFTGLPIVMGNDRSRTRLSCRSKATGCVSQPTSCARRSRAVPRFNVVLRRFVDEFMTQMVNTALSNGTATLGGTLGNMVVMANDRLVGDESAYRPVLVAHAGRAPVGCHCRPQLFREPRAHQFGAQGGSSSPIATG